MAGSSGPEAMRARARCCALIRCPSSAIGVVSATRTICAVLARAATPGRKRASCSRWTGPLAAGAALLGSR
eukprot:15481774-Alexandrium_andersonii.AAC.1